MLVGKQVPIERQWIRTASSPYNKPKNRNTTKEHEFFIIKKKAEISSYGVNHNYLEQYEVVEYQ